MTPHSIASVNDTLLAQLESSMQETLPLLPKAFLRILCKVLAGVFILLYRYAGWMLLQMFVAHASMRETTLNGRTLRPLVEWGRLIGVGDPMNEQRAELTVDVAVTSLGATLSAGAQLLHAETGSLYLTVAEVLLDAPVKTVSVRAATASAGAAGNRQPGETLRFASPLAQVARDVTVTALIVQGTDAEDEQDYRARVIRRFKRRPQGGASADYAQWGEEVPGVLEVLPYKGLPGEVDVYVLASETSSGDADGIPTAAQLSAVRDAIELNVAGKASRRPVGAAVNVRPIARTAFEVEVESLLVHDATPGAVAEAEKRIEAAVDEYLRSRRPFLLGLSELPRKNRITQAATAGVVSELADASGYSVAKVTVKRSAAPTVVYTLGDGELAKLGAISFV